MTTRITFQEGLDLFKNAPLEDLKKEAQKIRNQKKSL